MALSHALVREETHESTASLRLRIRQKLEAGCLLYESAPRLFCAPGTGKECDACGLVLDPAQLVMAIPLPHDTTFVLLHGDCFVLWDDVRRKPT